ncbi:MAG: hydantoinase/oxoprolinase family protein [Gammaproteobacteria bacterium]|nr:hydantoinase/oxoprolinase family protein [Gammaproteobacteria bacterium]
MGYTIDIDTGGTFTDGFIANGARAEAVKVPTTPHDLTVCFAACIEAAAARFGVAVEDLLYDTEIIRFSNTIGTNTIIQRDGARVGVLVTADRESSAPTSDPGGKSPLVAPDMVHGIAEETGPDGASRHAPAPEAVLAAAQTLIDRGARCLVVAFANSHLNPAHERAARAAIKREYPRDYLGSVPVFLASNISPRDGEAERVNAACINAYIHARLVRLLYKAGEDLRRKRYRGSLFIGHNDGAVARVAKTRAINTYNSGPAGGLMGARLVGELYGAEALISADMGGTSFDLGYVRGGEASYALTADVEGFRVNLPMLAIRAIGAGGGSIARVENGAIAVGPRSAGALPGPACFGLGGTEPTVTDANVVLGIIDPACFLGGGMTLDAARARAAIEAHVAMPLGIPIEEAALGIRAAVDAHMGRETKRLQEDAALGAAPLLVVYGGAGPAHCCEIARIAGLPRIVMTPFSAVFSAFGSSTMDVGHVYYGRVGLPLDEASFATLAEVLATLEAEAARDLRGEGYGDGTAAGTVELFLRPAGEGAEIRISAAAQELASAAGRATLRAAANQALGGAGGTIATLALRTRAPVPHFAPPREPRTAGDAAAACKGSRRTLLGADSGYVELPVYDLERLGHGHALAGPALLESTTTTLLLGAGWQLSVDAYRNCVMEQGAPA